MSASLWRYERASWWQRTGERWLIGFAGFLVALLVGAIFGTLAFVVVLLLTAVATQPAVRARVRSQLAARRTRAAGAAELEAAVRAERVYLGTSAFDGTPVTLEHAAVGEHVFLAGASGSGKTTTAGRLVLERRCAGRGVVSIDLKGDPQTTEMLAALDPGCQVFDLRDPDGPSFDPLRRGDATGHASMLTHLSEWSEDHYRLSSQGFLSQLLAALAAAGDGQGPAFDLDALMGYLAKPTKARELARALPERQRAALLSAIECIEADSSIKSGVSGMGARLANVVHSPSAGHRIGPDREGEAEIDLGYALHDGGIVHFSLPEPLYGDEAATLAALACGAAHAGAHAEGAACDLLIDEAHAMGAARLVRLIRMARSAGIGVILATQDSHDYAEHTEAIWGSCAAKIVHRQEGRSAEYAAQAAGTYKTHKTTERWEAGGFFSPPTTGGELSVREVDEFRVSPNVIRELPRGRAVVIARVPESRVELVEVAAP